ncbi:hypothetical protein Acid345_0183 [Candidatus Koribacter versatilis Ellin345]|uniref:Uncharacterized protein n=1 Tax=Koribacter versatilis (strain Ellin345) TaxID=204669 RepID=Q1IVB2_KORVE|nr:hypothetical protein [Candidatus Koribacter versatilis]ABF39188.1 hypothetical protein Acid345_0183 [Candidatus Koribacter versatilis Ellin345]
MGRAIGFIAVILIAAFGMYYYISASKAVSPANGVPQATVDTTGVEQDLLQIANAERRHWATNNKYASLDDLISSGELQMARTTRGPYSYSVDATASSFVARARASNPPQGAPANLSVDESMRVRHD